MTQKADSLRRPIWGLGLVLVAFALFLPLACSSPQPWVQLSQEDQEEESRTFTLAAGPSYNGPASLEERIAGAEVIVRATLSSVTSSITRWDPEYPEVFGIVVSKDITYLGTLEYTFAVSEYLKGTGDDEIVAVVYHHDLVGHASTGDALQDGADLLAARDARWDNRQAILFLQEQHPKGFMPDFPVADRYVLGMIDPSYGWSRSGVFMGDFYTIVSPNDKAWLPAAAVALGGPSGSGPRGNSRAIRFLLNAPGIQSAGGVAGSSTRGVSGTSDSSTITLAQMKAKVRAIEQEVIDGGGSDAYRACIAKKYEEEAYIAWLMEGRVGKYPVQRHDYTMASGQPVGTRVRGTYSPDRAAELRAEHGDMSPPPGYNVFQLLDNEAGLFNSDWTGEVRTTRPLPVGEYKFTGNWVPKVFLVCDGQPEEQKKDGLDVLTVTAPAGTVHEAFFDPQTIGSGDGYLSSGNLSTGDLSPAAFTTGDTTTTITSIYGTGDAVTMILSPYVDLTTHIFDFITGDGTTMLSLTGATGDSAAGALTWGVSKQPWSSGDELMLRISEPLITLSDNLAQKESSDTTLNLGSGYTTGPVLYQKLGPKVKLDNGTWAYGSEHDKFAVHRITLASDPGVRLTARFCRYDDDLHTIYHGTDSTFDYSPAIYEDCLAGDFVSSSDTAEGRRVLLHSAGGSVEVPGNGQKESQKWYLRIAPSDVSASGFKVRFTNSNEETGWAIANKVLWTEVNTGGSGSNDKANRLGKSVALQIDGRRLGCPSGMNFVDGKCITS